jgi:hypothetical protein
MSLLPLEASFEELVCDCFFAFRGSGLMLSPLDRQLLDTWARESVPLEVVARGIRLAAERAAWDARPGQPLLRTLRSCQRQVEKEVAHFRARAVGARPEDSSSLAGETYEAKRHRKLWASMEALAGTRPELQATLLKLLATDGPLARLPPTPESAARRTDLVTCGLLRGLPFDERQRLLGQARVRLGGARTSPWARKLALRFHRAMVVGDALGVEGL